MPMYSNCIFCYADLGSNEAIEAFPVGSRVAYDPGKGRLWSVCPLYHYPAESCLTATISGSRVFGVEVTLRDAGE